MKKREFSHILTAVLVMTVVIGFTFTLNNQWGQLAQAFLFAVLIILIPICSKKLMAFVLDSNIEHEIWQWERYGLKKHHHLEKPLSVGVAIPLVFTLFTLGLFKVMTFLTYETRALKVRAARRFGFYSFTEMTDWHNALIGAAGIISLIILSTVSYFLPFSGAEYLAKLSAYYAFWNLVPISKLDGTQIFFGSRVLYATLAIITLIFTAYALILP